MSDLVQQLRERPLERSLWEAFYKSFHPVVYYTAYKLTRGDVEGANDLTQEAFLRFFYYKAYLRTEADENAGAYLRQVTRRLALDFCRSKAREALQQHLLIHTPEPERSQWSECFDTEDTAQLRQDVKSLAGYLSDSDRDLLWRLLRGESLKETAAHLNVTYHAAAVRMHRLRRKIENRGSLGEVPLNVPKIR